MLTGPCRWTKSTMRVNWITQAYISKRLHKHSGWHAGCISNCTFNFGFLFFLQEANNVVSGMGRKCDYDKLQREDVGDWPSMHDNKMMSEWLWEGKRSIINHQYMNRPIGQVVETTYRTVRLPLEKVLNLRHLKRGVLLYKVGAV